MVAIRLRVQPQLRHQRDNRDDLRIHTFDLRQLRGKDPGSFPFPPINHAYYTIDLNDPSVIKFFKLAVLFA